MTTISLPTLDSPLLTHSRMTCAKACMKRHWFAYEIGLRRDRESTPLRMGSAFHEGLDRLAKGDPVDVAIATATASYGTLPRWACTEEHAAEWATEAATVATMLVGYADRWAESIVAEVLESEIAFDLPLVNPETGRPSTAWRLAGKIDKIARLRDGRVAIVEHKTCGEDIGPDSSYWTRLRIDQQISLYWIAARELGHDVETVLYDVARKPSIRPKLVKGVRETPEQYADRLAADMADRPDFYFARREIPRLQADLDLAARELWAEQLILSHARRGGLWPRNTSACLRPYACEYLSLCTNGYDAADGVPDGFALSPAHPELNTGEIE